MIKLILPGAQACLNIAEAFPERQLPESHAQKLVPAGKRFHFVLTVIPTDATPELLGMNKIEELGKNKFSGVHPAILPGD